MQTILTCSSANDKAINYKFLFPWLGTGLLTSSGSKWKSRRKLLTPSFHFKILTDFIPIINEQSDILVTKIHSIRQNQIKDVVKYISNCTLDIICETAMGVNVNAQDNPNSKYVKSVHLLAESFIYRNLQVLAWSDWMFYMTKLGKEYLQSLEFLHKFTKDVILQRKQAHQRGEINTENKQNQDLNSKKRLAFLDLLLEHHLKNVEPKLTEEDIREEVDTFMFEGHDTTAMAISYTLFLLGHHDEIQQNIHDELDSIFGKDKSRQIGTEDLSQMKYLECCIKETLRIFPPVPIIARQLKDDVMIEGHKIPKDTTALVPIYATHRDIEIYPNPERFDPNRFLPEQTNRRHPFAYIPFSAGQRNCIGQRFALMEEKIILANILRNFKVKSLIPIDQIIVAIELVTRNKTPLTVQFTPRCVND